MKKAGVDLGSSLTKVAFRNSEGAWVFLSTADYSLEFIAEELTKNGITELNVCGINKLPENFTSFKIIRPSGNLIDNEIKFQAIGAHELLRLDGCAKKDFLLVSIGTGTSYTFVSGAVATRFPIGNSLGGGFLRGVALYMNIGADLLSLDPCFASDQESLDLLVKDLITETKGTPIGELVVANFGKIDYSNIPSLKAKQKALINVVATAISRDIIILNMLRGLASEIVIVGSVVQKCLMIREMLASNCKQHLGITPIFPENSAFALAVGCLC